jgi:pyruvate dehydrogenase E2 component (dihydrolipoamide acetyltransferase)
LITPIVNNADKLGLSGINSTVLDLATRARDGKLKPEEYQGGTFTISNLGMFGITSFNAVINPPQSCILAVSGGVSRVLPPKKLGATGKDGQPRVATTITVQLSSDRRVVDEAIAAQYCQVFSYYLSNPKLIML